jgi:copper(I)-binding protein
MMRPTWPAWVAVAVAVAGAAGLIRAAAPQSSGAAPSAAPIVITGAYVRPPVAPTDAAAAYFTITNTTGRADRLVSVTSGAGAAAMLHTSGMRMNMSGAVVPAHGRLVLSTGKGHVMVEHLFGTLRPGENVNFDLSFADAGTISVTAPVIALGAPAPGGG